MRTVLGPPVIPLKPEERPSQDFDLSTVSMRGTSMYIRSVFSGFLHHRSGKTCIAPNSYSAAQLDLAQLFPVSSSSGGRTRPAL